MTIENAAVLGLLGIGGLISGYFTLLWQRRSTDLAKKQEYKETRYKCIILLMHGCLDFERSRGELQKYGYSIDTVDDLTALLRAEHINSFLYASDDFIRSLSEFIQTPTETSLVKAALNIRKDLWGVKTMLSLSDIPELPNQTDQRTGASRSAQKTNRTSPAAGSRR
jgi:hypothetical protein